MTSGLRKVHKYIWLVLIVVIPPLLIFSIKDLDIFSSESNAFTEFETSKNNVLATAENDLIKVSLIKKDAANAIEVILKSSLKNPSSVVFALDDKGKKGVLIGQLTSLGIYNFALKEPIKGIIIYDNLKEKLITKLMF